MKSESVRDTVSEESFNKHITYAKVKETKMPAETFRLAFILDRICFMLFYTWIEPSLTVRRFFSAGTHYIS